MISVITAVHNQLAVNRLFFENLQRYTRNAFELIIIDNASTDGSAEFFESVGARVIRNQYNYSYPYSQNQGIALARYDWLVFMNNDVVVSPDWDQRIMESMLLNGLEVATVCGVERIETQPATKKIKRRWKRIRSLWSIFSWGCFCKWHYFILRTMHRWMYGDWEYFCNQRYVQFRHRILEGFVGNTVVMQRSALDKIGLWDERIQGADFDLYLRTKQREETHRDIKAVHICLDVFVHHYVRLTMKATYPPFQDRVNLITLEEKWSKDSVYLKLLKSIS